MDSQKIFVDFLKLTYFYFREEKNIEFYAKRLDVTKEMLKAIIEESSDSSFESWLESLEKNTR